jgi:hypothetical protein
MKTHVLALMVVLLSYDGAGGQSAASLRGDATEAPPEKKPAAAPGDPDPSEFEPVTLSPLEGQPDHLKSGTVGGQRGWGKALRDVAPVGHVLAGFDYTLGRYEQRIVIIGSLQPIYTLGWKSQRGKVHGKPQVAPRTVVAKQGYAVGAIEAKGAGVLDGFRLVFMRQRLGTLDPTDSYRSEWIGGTGGTEARLLSGEGRPIAGILTMMDKDVNQLSVIVRKN